MDDTARLGLHQPAPEDYADIAALNENFALLDRAVLVDQETGKLPMEELPDIDCGLFEDALTAGSHNASPYTHRAMSVDGNATEAADLSVTLEEHISAENAHQNLRINGNMN